MKPAGNTDAGEIEPRSTTKALINIKSIALGKGKPRVGRLLLSNAPCLKFRELKLRRGPQCTICGDHPTIRELIDYDLSCGIQPAPADEIDHSVPKLFTAIRGKWR